MDDLANLVLVWRAFFEAALGGLTQYHYQVDEL